MQLFLVSEKMVRDLPQLFYLFGSDPNPKYNPISLGRRGIFVGITEIAP